MNERVSGALIRAVGQGPKVEACWRTCWRLVWVAHACLGAPTLADEAPCVRRARPVCGPSRVGTAYKWEAIHRPCAAQRLPQILPKVDVFDVKSAYFWSTQPALLGGSRSLFIFLPSTTDTSHADYPIQPWSCSRLLSVK